MTTLKYIIPIITISFLSTFQVAAQGCSDAGFCTINSFKPENVDSTEATKSTNNQLKIGGFFGNADRSISVYGVYLEYNRKINDKFGMDVKITSMSQNGNGISTFGLSDFFVNGSYKAFEKVKFTLGMKLPLNNANRKENNNSLPMDYQSSLGTFDLLVGVGYEIKKVQFVAAIQQPLTQNGNQFSASDYALDSPLRNFQSTNQYNRKGDILLRVSYPISLHKKLKITPSILPIYHLANDTYIDALNVKQQIVGSEGLTLNGNIYLDYSLSEKHALQLNIAAPFLVRKARPDGLTRSLVVNLEYRIMF